MRSRTTGVSHVRSKLMSTTRRSTALIDLAAAMCGSMFSPRMHGIENAFSLAPCLPPPLFRGEFRRVTGIFSRAPASAGVLQHAGSSLGAPFRLFLNLPRLRHSVGATSRRIQTVHHQTVIVALGHDSLPVIISRARLPAERLIIIIIMTTKARGGNI